MKNGISAPRIELAKRARRTESWSLARKSRRLRARAAHGAAGFAEGPEGGIGEGFRGIGVGFRGGDLGLCGTVAEGWRRGRPLLAWVIGARGVQGGGRRRVAATAGG